jgi:hypothetical protein
VKALALAKVLVDYFAGTAGKGHFHFVLLSATKKAPRIQ